MEEESPFEPETKSQEQSQSTQKSEEKKNEKQNEKKNEKQNGKKKKSSKSKKKEKKNEKKNNGKNKDADKGLIRLPPCQHAYCLGEVLKKAGLEPGVCRPRPLPWALTGNLLYLPGWEKECKNYRLQEICYEVKPKKLNPNQERYANELKEARTLWSFLKPALLYPRNPVYEDPEPGIPCDCKAGTCKRPPEEGNGEEV